MATETAVDVVMPQMGVSVSEGTITRWLKQEGEQVEADEPLLEISTDKVDTEVPSPGSGTLTQILVQEGATVDVGTKLGQIGGSASEAPAAEAAEPEAPTPAAEEAPAPATAEAAAEADAASPAETPAPTAPEPSAAPAPSAASTPSGNGKAFVSPVVARIAGEHGIDPSQVPGTGSCGRVTEKDHPAVGESGGAQPEAAQPQAPAQPPPAEPETPAPTPPAQAPPPPPKPAAPA